jgi:adenylate cyclase
MVELVAFGPDGQPRWRQELPPRPVTLGRLAPSSEWNCPWDDSVSRLHATLTWEQDRLRVRREPASRNPIYFRGQPADEFTAVVGESFIVGQTRFALESGPPVLLSPDPTPQAELTCSRQQLRDVKYLDPDTRIAALAALPELIRFSSSDAELERHVLDVLLQGIPRAIEAAVVQVRPPDSAGVPKIEVRASVARDQRPGPMPLSRRLVLDAVSVRLQSVLYRWDMPTPSRDFTVQRLLLPETSGDLGGEAPAPSRDFTVQPAVDWAICVPLSDVSSPGWGLYVNGRLEGVPAAPAGVSQGDLLSGDLKFTELVADVFGSFRLVRDLQQRQAVLTRFLSRPVLAALAMNRANLDEVLRRRPAEVTVLFCDIRGSCLLGEEGQDDLPGLWDQVSAALGTMTSNIIDLDGVVADFQGDAALGFWGWPLQVPDQVERAARAALNIRRDFLRAAQQPGSPLAGFSYGVGIASGTAVAGKLGTYDQFKVGVFGPVVNLASRLESMTKQFQAPILVDEATAQRLAAGNTGHWCRCRRLAHVRPYGMKAALTVSELLPSEVEPGALREGDRKSYEAALDAFLAGRWRDAARLLQRLPPEDGPAGFLGAFMDRHRGAPPPGWDGTIELTTK